ncbi:hypothetical protein R6Q57_021391 [Mikania cordata]
MTKKWVWGYVSLQKNSQKRGWKMNVARSINKISYEEGIYSMEVAYVDVITMDGIYSMEVAYVDLITMDAIDWWSNYGWETSETSSLWKLQWFVVGWINPNNKYCTKVDASRNANPVWKTKFSALINNSNSRFEDLALNVEVYSRDPVFLKEKLQGAASVGLKEFIDKHNSIFGSLRYVEEARSFQLRTKNPNKPKGFVDVMIVGQLGTTMFNFG